MHNEHSARVIAGMNYCPTSRSRTLARVVSTLCAVLVLSATVAKASIRWATLEAIHQLENPNNSARPGPFGELGAYQFRSSTWRMHTKAPFLQALDRQTSDAVAVQHYEWLKRGLEEARLPVTPYNIALAWNGGLSAVIAGSSPRVAHDYAMRAANLTAVFDDSARYAVAVRTTPPSLVATSGIFVLR